MEKVGKELTVAYKIPPRSNNATSKEIHERLLYTNLHPVWKVKKYGYYFLVKCREKKESGRVVSMRCYALFVSLSLFQEN